MRHVLNTFQISFVYGQQHTSYSSSLVSTPVAGDENKLQWSISRVHPSCCRCCPYPSLNRVYQIYCPHLDVITIIHQNMPGRVAQSVGHPTRKSGVLGSKPGLATYFRFSFRCFKKGSCQLLAKVCARSTG